MFFCFNKNGTQNGSADIFFDGYVLIFLFSGNLGKFGQVWENFGKNGAGSILI